MDCLNIIKLMLIKEIPTKILFIKKKKDVNFFKNINILKTMSRENNSGRKYVSRLWVGIK